MGELSGSRLPNAEYSGVPFLLPGIAHQFSSRPLRLRLLKTKLWKLCGGERGGKYQQAENHHQTSESRQADRTWR